MAKKVTTPVSNTPESVASGGAGNPASTAAAAEPASEASVVSPVKVAIAAGSELAAMAPSLVGSAVHDTEMQPKATELRSFAVTKPVRYQRRRYAKGEPVTVDMDEWAVLFVGGVLAEEWDAVTAGEA